MKKRLATLPGRTRLTAAVAAVFLLAPAVSTATYIERDHQDQGTFADARQRAAPSAGGSLVFYDNLNDLPEAAGRGPLLHWEADPFVPVLRLDPNPPLRMVIPRPGGSLDARLLELLYANLKAAKILEEYRALQERTRELLAGLVSESSVSRRTGLQAPQLLEIAAGRTGGPGPLSIAAAVETLHREQRAVAGRGALGAAGEDDQGALFVMAQSLSGRSEAARLSESRRSTEGPAQVFGASEAGSDRSAGSGEPEETERLRSANRAIEVQRRPLGDAPALPWFLSVLLKTVKFIFVHKLEILAAVLASAAFLVIVACVRPR